jgi:hypothetical protein
MSVQSKTARIEFSVNLDKEQVWELVSDTNRLGELIFKDKPVEMVRRDAKSAVMKHHAVGEFEELPWAFEVPNFFKTTRLFSHKYLKKLDQECRLTEEGGNTKVVFEIKMETTKNTGGSVILKVGTGHLVDGLEKVKEAVLKAAKRDVFSSELPVSPGDAKKIKQRCEARLVNLPPKLSDKERDIIHKIIHHMANGSSEEVARMRPYVLARRWKEDRRTVLTCFLHATRVGLARLSWDLLCPSCAGGPLTIPSLKDLPSTGHCESCDISYDVDFAEVSFVCCCR